MRKPRDQLSARKAYGDEVVDEMIAHPTLNQKCHACQQHHGLVCVCTMTEKAAAVPDRQRITPATYR